MALSAAAIAAIIGGAVAITGASAGAIGSAVNNSKAKAERSRSYREAKEFLSSQYYRDPLSAVGNRSLLKNLDQRLEDQNDAMQNRAVAGGATMENQLAARKANNRALSDVYTNLLMGEDARRDRINQQRLALDQNYSQGLQQDYLRSAQNWQTWGSQVFNAGMSVASSSLLSGAGSAAGSAAGAGAGAAAGGGYQYAPLAPAASGGSGLVSV